jgi:N-acetylglutamate synthase-like GNAT family acetyltransferase
MLGPSGGARFVDAELDAGMMRSVRKAKRDTPDLFAIDMNDEDNEAINIESIIHAEAMRRSADDEDSSDDDESEADFDVEDDEEYHGPQSSDNSDGEEYHGPQSSDNSDGDGDKESGVGKKSKGKAAGRKKKSEAQRKEEHNELVDKCFPGFHCQCARAKTSGNESCLEAISKQDLRAIHRETYGDGKAVQPAQVLHNIHSLYWALSVPLPTPKGAPSLKSAHEGRTRKLPSPLKLLGKYPVCSRAFQMAVGGSRFAHRSKIHLVTRGFGPQSLKSAQLAKVELRALEERKGVKTRRAAWARTWWADELALHDWLPNETAIQFKGVPWDLLHREHYTAAAVANSGDRPLKYKAWKAQMLPGARLLAEAQDPPPEDYTKIRVRRSARHSNFPECNDCKRLRQAYMDVMTTAGSSQARRDTALNALKAHMNDWQKDRALALKLKDHASGFGRDTCYECDDKCGSHWLMMPVAPQGRDTKDLAKHKFDFAIQCNTVVGKGGVNRFMVVPAHVRTGSNFGLTSFIMALYGAHKNGRFNDGAGKTLYRHTDGGSDNLSVVTHVMHWLLVWLGIFEELIWFRFDAGHSHTEMCDRFFSMIKRFFKIDGAARCERLDSFEEFEDELRKLFTKSDGSTVELEYLLANWDFEHWFKACGNDAKKHLGGISFDNVFSYKYDPSAWDHGCVKVTYKDRLSRTTSRDGKECEWSPFTAVTKDGTTRNVTDATGVRFVGCPPRIMQTEPLRENYRDMDQDEEDDEGEGEQPKGERGGGKKSATATSKSIQNLLTKRHGKADAELSEKAKAHWNALKLAFDAGLRAGALPDMPATYGGISFAGCPRPFLPILREMRRFPRPYIYWDPFRDEPPSSWPDAATARAAQEAKGGQPADVGEPDRQGGDSEGGLRDARQHCNVTGLHYTKGQRTSALREVTEEEWVAGFADVAGKNRKEPVKEGLLYLMQLAVPEGGFKLGFAQAGKAQLFGLEDGDQHQAKWFVKTGETTTWSETPTFIPYMIGQKRSVEYVPSESFLMEVDDRWLTEGTVAAKHTDGFRITKDFMKRLRRLKDEYATEFGDDDDSGRAPTLLPTGDRAADATPSPPAGNSKRPADQGGAPNAKRHVATAATRAAPHAAEAADTRASDISGSKRTVEGGGAGAASSAAIRSPKRQASAAAAPPVQPTGALAKRPATAPKAAVDLAVQELEALLPEPRYRVTKEMGSAVSDKEFKEDVRALIETGLQPCGIVIATRDMRTKLSGLKSKKWIVIRDPAAAQGDASVLGFIAYSTEERYIHELHVCADLQGKGVGRALLNAAEADLRSMGLDSSYLTVHVANARARALYERLGYRSEHDPAEIKESCGHECVELCKALF